ncbi:MAG: 16S rRNA (adenine(1518)-N(6)/adenine(1519)-N(6))-dimethyltransferase, partial [Gemmatimonadetes bacterium]|nr:16S rRNA (adenine(1518)-N(6)/adenine(1519)-N(6))-dimethyltransferase [Gemmatimonadota bacterium]
VVRLAPRRHPLTRDEEEERRVRRLIRAVFQRRRQQLQRVLRETWRLTPEAAAGALAAAGIEAAARPEELSPDRFVALARAVAAA